MAKLITKEQMAEQESYIMKLKEENMRYAAQNGHAKLALTETYGCQQNENDTERIRGMLRQAGFDFTDDSNKADVVIYNTCAVRENAEQKVFGRLGILKHIKEERKAQASAQLAAENVAMQLEKRVAFRRAMKKVIQGAQKSGAKGTKKIRNSSPNF